ncbi:hypothetical protein LOAG_15622 [Loa loa]|uniref:Uncharacterized protein n=1 Tax=Loa loa TaxID=7209 RepID=A0A1S0TFF7_LOALO|nr:hypothetical protein LOAG_15622 [Loa loa]EFO12909.1 hypothetical protein LOAG_15622 [Loa loa]
MDLARIDGVIPYISQQQLELFLGSADIFETNILLKINSLRISVSFPCSDSIDLLRNEDIKNSSKYNATFLDVQPMLLRGAFNDAQLTKTKICFLFLQNQKSTLIFENVTKKTPSVVFIIQKYEVLPANNLI